MSVELLLIPAALAAGAAIRARREKAASPEVIVESAMTDIQLLGAAAEVCADRVKAGADGSISFELRGMNAVVRRDVEAGLRVSVSGAADDAHAIALVEDLEGEYRRLVQERSYARVLREAASQGLMVESEVVQDDGSILVTLLLSDDER